MNEILTLAIAVVVFALPAFFLAMATRHFFPLIKGFDAPIWIYAIAPIAFFFDRYFSESARPHRKKFLVYEVLFFVSCAALYGVVHVFGRQ